MNVAASGFAVKRPSRVPGDFAPSVEVTEVSKDRVCFTLRNADDSLANALRRILVCS